MTEKAREQVRAECCFVDLPVHLKMGGSYPEAETGVQLVQLVQDAAWVLQEWFHRVEHKMLVPLVEVEEGESGNAEELQQTGEEL